MKRKMLIIGLDGVSWNVLDPMIENGYMPFLQDFIKKGKSGILKSTQPPITPTAWTSFMTGFPPEVHDVRGFRNFQLENGKLTYFLNNSSNIKHKNLWHVLSENDKKVCIVNLPLTYPPFEVNGIMISGFPAPSMKEYSYTYPEELKNEILKEIPDYQPSNWGDATKGMNFGIECFVEHMIKMTSQRAQLSTYLFDKEDWDCFMVHFQETDFLQHRFWHYIDKGHQDFSEAGFKYCAQYYSFLDSKLSQLVSIARNKNFSILFMSDHGFQRWEYNIRINNWLVSEKFLHIHKSIKNSAISLAKNILNVLPRSLIEKFNREGRMKKSITNRYLEEVIDYNRSFVFIETNSTNVAFAHFTKNISVEMRDKIINKLFSLTVPGGKKLISEILPYQNSSHVFKIIFMGGIAATGALVTEEPWCTKPVVGKNNSIGIHHEDGIIIADNSFKQYYLPEEIYEIFELVLTHQGVSLPNINWNNAEVKLTGEEKEQIEKSLKSLGYL